MAVSQIPSPSTGKSALTKRAAKRRVTLNAFLNSPNEEFSEWVDGEVIRLSVTPEHQDISDFLAALLRLFTEAHNLGRILTVPCAMKLVKRPSGREPDIMFIAAERTDLIGEKYVDGAADVVVEVISEESRTRDRRDKFCYSPKIRDEGSSLRAGD